MTSLDRAVGALESLVDELARVRVAVEVLAGEVLDRAPDADLGAGPVIWGPDDPPTRIVALPAPPAGVEGRLDELAGYFRDGWRAAVESGASPGPVRHDAEIAAAYRLGWTAGYGGDDRDADLAASYRHGWHAGYATSDADRDRFDEMLAKTPDPSATGHEPERGAMPDETQREVEREVEVEVEVEVEHENPPENPEREPAHEGPSGPEPKATPAG